MATREASQSYPGMGPRRPPGRRLLAVGAVLLAVCVVAYGVVTFAVYDGLSRRVACAYTGSPDAFATDVAHGLKRTYPIDVRPYLMPVPQDVTFASRDPGMGSARLAGWWIPADEASASAAAPAVVVVHGVQACRREPSILLAAGMLHRNGYSVFLLDLRDHGDSGGDDGRFAGGTEEYLDVLGAWDWVRAQGVPPARIGIAGFSFGSATTMIAAGEEPLVPAAWVDSGYPRIQAALDEFLQDHGPFPAPISTLIVPGAALVARVVAGDDILRFDPVEELARLGGRSIAFVHGAADATLPAAWATELRDAAVSAGATSPAVWVVPAAGHTEAIYLATAEYEARLVSFFDGTIGPGATAGP